MTDVDWGDGVVFVDERVATENTVERECEGCEAEEMHTSMAETEEAGLGPAYVCFRCGHVFRI